MIAFLDGQLIEITPTQVVLGVGGVGYAVHISLYTYEQIQGKPNCRLYTHLHIKEDAHTLYGFSGKEERELFQKLIAVSGIGPGTARMVLSSMSPQELTQAILSEDEDRIKSIKGIGPKSAKRLILEMKDKVSASGPIAESIPGLPRNTMQEEALSALVMLGFARPASEKAISKVIKNQPVISSVEALIKLALQNM
ncbi:MAG: Holliday junction branch migration protein RuvA [Bacteroidetes bacterium]|nr:Holliday junction branch migration protein RuvA [Bacteroidota bacterium]